MQWWTCQQRDRYDCPIRLRVSIYSPSSVMFTLSNWRRLERSIKLSLFDRHGLRNIRQLHSLLSNVWRQNRRYFIDWLNNRSARPSGWLTGRQFSWSDRQASTSIPSSIAIEQVTLPAAARWSRRATMVVRPSADMVWRLVSVTPRSLAAT